MAKAGRQDRKLSVTPRREADALLLRMAPLPREALSGADRLKVVARQALPGILTALLTAFYTFRMVSLVFFGESRSHSHPHPAGGAMKVALGLLAFGTLVTWLAAGPLPIFSWVRARQ